MKKILVLATLHPLTDNRIFFKEIESLKKISSDITFGVPHSDKNISEYNGIKIHPFNIQRSILKRLFTSHVDAYKLIKREQYDYIHFHDPELMILLSFIKLISKTKIIFDIHENIGPSIKDKYWIPKPFRGIITVFYTLMEKILIKNFDALVIAETSYRQTYGEKPVEVLNYPRLLERNSQLKKKFSSNLNFVYAGDIMSRKGVWVMLDLFEKLYSELSQKPHLDLLGRFVPPDLEQDVKEFINRKGLNDKVSIHGKVTIDEVNRILEESHIGFSILEPVANYIGSLPTKIFDYMNNKMVVITSDIPLYKTYVDDHGIGVSIDFYQYSKHFDEILILLQSHSKLSEMAETGYQKVKNKWNWEEQEKKLLNIYKD